MRWKSVWANVSEGFGVFRLAPVIKNGCVSECSFSRDNFCAKKTSTPIQLANKAAITKSCQNAASSGCAQLLSY